MRDISVPFFFKIYHGTAAMCTGKIHKVHIVLLFERRGTLPTHGHTAHPWAVFPWVGTRPTNGQSAPTIQSIIHDSYWYKGVGSCLHRGTAEPKVSNRIDE